MNKICSKCNIEKRLAEFYKDKNAKGGHRTICKACDISRRMAFAKANPVQNSALKKRYYNNNLDKIRKQAYIYRDSGQAAEWQRNHYYKNRDTILEKARIKDKERRETDILYKLRRITSNRITTAIIRQGFKKKSKTATMLGCDWLELKAYLESNFLPGMSWDNYGKWHIDHIKPCCSASNIEELEKLQHYANLQPLWAEDNLKKSGKYL